MSKHAFLIGTGFIGGTVLTDLLKPETKSAFGIATISALTRRDNQATKLESLGVRPVRGSLSDADAITTEVAKSDIVIHTATADDVPSVRAVLDGLRKRGEEGKPTVYLHTSGAGVLDDDAKGSFASSKVYSDERPEEIDAIPESAYHRETDLTITKALPELLPKGQRVAILLPPCIYGNGTGPFNTQSIQIPTITAAGFKNGFVPVVGEGKSLISAVHVTDLADAYLLILKYLSDTPTLPTPWNPYFFATPAYDGSQPNEPGPHEFSWIAISRAIRDALVAHGSLPESAEVRTDTADAFDAVGVPRKAAEVDWGYNSRTRATRLPKLGWTPKAGKDIPDVWGSIKGTVNAVVAQAEEQ